MGINISVYLDIQGYTLSTICRLACIYIYIYIYSHISINRDTLRNLLVHLVTIARVWRCIDQYPVMLAYIMTYLEIYSCIHSVIHIDIVVVYRGTYPEPFYCILKRNDLYLWVHICISIYLSLYVYIHIHTPLSLYIYIYVYILIHPCNILMHTPML